MKRTRIIRTTAAALLLGAAGLATSLPASGQEATDTSSAPLLLQFGWWNKAQQSPAGGQPAPRPPGAPENGIFIAYEPTAGPAPAPLAGAVGVIGSAPAPAPVVIGPEAFGAVRYAVPAGSEGELTLRFTPTSTSQPGGVNPDAGDLFACPVSSAWDPVQNGRYNSAPKYDCTIGVKAAYSGDSVTFTLPAALSSTGTLDLAIVPQGAKPFKLSIFAPDDRAVALTSVPESESTSSEEAFDPGTVEDPSASFDSTFTDDTAGSFATEQFASDGTTSGGDFDSSAFSTTAGRRVATGARAKTPGAGIGRQVGVPASAVLANPFRRDASRSERMMAVAALFALAAGLWWVGGQPIRAPRLLGSLGAGQAVTSPDDERTGGIGRFAKARPALRPPRLF